MTRDIAHLSAVELFTPVLDETVGFFEGPMAMEVVSRRGDSVYLHSWDDYESFTVKVTGHHTSGIGRTWLRAASPEALDRRVRAIEAATSTPRSRRRSSTRRRASTEHRL